MATKGQKFMKVPDDLKRQILKEYYDGSGGTHALGKKYNVSRHTIDTWIYSQKKGIDIFANNKIGRNGRPRTKDLTIEDYKERYEILKKYQAFLEARHGKK